MGISNHKSFEDEQFEFHLQVFGVRLEVRLVDLHLSALLLPVILILVVGGDGGLGGYHC